MAFISRDIPAIRDFLQKFLSEYNLSKKLLLVLGKISIMGAILRGILGRGQAAERTGQEFGLMLIWSSDGGGVRLGMNGENRNRIGGWCTKK